MQFLEVVRVIVKTEQAQGRVVCILTPNKKWFRHLMVAGVQKEVGSCWFRSSAKPAELKAIRFDTLITVQICRPEGYGLARECLRLSPNPRTYQIIDQNLRDL